MDEYGRKTSSTFDHKRHDVCFSGLSQRELSMSWEEERHVMTTASIGGIQEEICAVSVEREGCTKEIKKVRREKRLWVIHSEHSLHF